LYEFRDGCSLLIFAKHEPLADDDRRWLARRCRQWAVRLDKHLESLESGQDPVAVRGEVDETVNMIIEALRSRAEDAKG
jgi:hypothetical protein